MGCEHCSHPLWAGIKCSQCGRWYDECRTCGKRGCEECMKAGLKQAWENYQEAIKRFDRPRCGHNCCREWQGLTDTEIGMLYVKWDATPDASVPDFARAIEAALKEKNK